jgi:hypothetical protein
MWVTLYHKHPSYSTIKNWAARFRKGSGRPTQVTITENIDAIHSMTLNDERIYAEKTSEALVIYRERVG